MATGTTLTEAGVEIKGGDRKTPPRFSRRTRWGLGVSTGFLALSATAACKPGFPTSAPPAPTQNAGCSASKGEVHGLTLDKFKELKTKADTSVNAFETQFVADGGQCVGGPRYITVFWENGQAGAEDTANGLVADLGREYPSAYVNKQGGTDDSVVVENVNG